jgi:hypothetical protein
MAQMPTNLPQEAFLATNRQDHEPTKPDSYYENRAVGCSLAVFAILVVAGIGMLAAGISQGRAHGWDPGGPGDLPGPDLFLKLGGMLMLAVAWLVSVLLTGWGIIRVITARRWSWWAIRSTVYALLGVAAIVIYGPQCKW